MLIQFSVNFIFQFVRISANVDKLSFEVKLATLPYMVNNGLLQ